MNNSSQIASEDDLQDCRDVFMQGKYASCYARSGKGTWNTSNNAVLELKEEVKVSIEILD